MKMEKIINESGGYIKHSKPSTEKLKIPNSAYGNQPITTFNKGDQDSAMNYWKDILKHFNQKTKLSEQEMISEIPWIDLGKDEKGVDIDPIDLGLETVNDPDEALRKIKSIIKSLPTEKQFKFKKELMNNYKGYLQRKFNISFGDLGV